MEVFKRQGRNVTEEEMASIIEEINPIKENEITFAEFCKLMH